MKGSTGVFAVGVLVGVIGALVAVKLRRGGASLDLDGLGERIQDNLAELESRLQAITSSTEPAA